MQIVKVNCPAKINLSLKVVGKRPDGYHNIESIMQTINLYDYLTVKVSEEKFAEIALSGNSNEISYDETNLVYRAAKLYLDTSKIKNKHIEIYIEKNIPVSAGLAGGSTDAAGTLYALNSIFNLMNTEQLHSLCAALGSDLNVCLQGGRLMTRGRGEIIEPMPFEEFSVSLMKPINLGISAKEAYAKFSQKSKDPTVRNDNIFSNDLEWAVIGDYKELQYIKQKYPDAVMTGSGSTYFRINGEFAQENSYRIMNNLRSINLGVHINKTGE